MKGVGKKRSFANSCFHRKDCCSLFSLSLSLLPALSFHPFAMNVALTPVINSAQMPNSVTDFVRLLFSIMLVISSGLNKYQI